MDQLLETGILHADDLSFNRQLELTPRQVRKLKLRLGFQAVPVILMLIAIPFYTYAEIFYLKSGAVVFTIYGILIVSISYGLSNAKPYWLDSQYRSLRAIEGRVHKSFSFGRSGRHQARIGNCQIHIHDRAFVVSPAIYDGIIEGEVCRFYYAEQSGFVLNIERLHAHPAWRENK